MQGQHNCGRGLKGELDTLIDPQEHLELTLFHPAIEKHSTRDERDSAMIVARL
jgi:hypothetical protein